jgi:cytochrome c oxidase subunit 1
MSDATTIDESLIRRDSEGVARLHVGPDFHAEQHIHPDPTSFVKKYIFSKDHKMIAKQFLWLGLAGLAIGGTMAMMIRWQIASPGTPFPVLGNLMFPRAGGVLPPQAYASFFTMHGTIMIFFAITPILIGAFGNYCIPLMIGARDMAFPTLNMLSLWTFILSQGLIIASFLVRLGSGAAGWTTYPPISTNVGTPGMGQTLVVAAIFVTGISTIMGGINYITTVIRFRAPGMTWMRMPLTVWGLWLTAILNVLFVPVLGAAGLLLLFDRNFGTQFFVAGSSSVRGGGDPILFQHLFWIFGHPEVYILILPVWGIVSDILSFFARKPAHWYAGSVGAMVAVTGLSAVVYGHHMYMTGMSPLLGQSFMLLTLAISVPAMVLFVNWLMTIWKGSTHLTVPMLFALGMVFVFGAGGLTGLYLADISLDLYLHDTMFVVGHFHLTMAAASFLGNFAGIYHWFPKMFGRNMNQTLGKLHFWGSVIFITLVFSGQLIVGYSGQQRRLFDPFQYHFLEHLRDLNRMTSFAGFCLAASQVFFVINFFKSVFAGSKAEANPWGLPTLEWETTSPPPYHNFDVIPVVVRGPHEFANPAVKKALGRDYLNQTEEWNEGEASESKESPKLAEQAS